MRPSFKFPTTRWTLVVSAGQERDAQSTDALASLCERYWYPIYAFTRRRGYTSDESQDLTQAFFVQVLEKQYLGRADREKGRFRTFLLSSLQFFLCDQADRRQALKRGGGSIHLPFEVQSAESLYQREPCHHETPERVFERRWALALLERVLARLRDDFVREGNADHFDHLKIFLLDAGEVPYSTAALELGISEGALKVAVHRLRKRYREVFRNEIADTVASPSEIEGEIRYLLQALSQ